MPWPKVDDLTKALGNMQGYYGLEEPMAVIDNDKEN